ncbi:hypothetical protein O6H91_08G028000 [Diphasiastrum complanatum]|nr:hypothetical protein O6H91_08G028000 [Diphasiastrum complanatum]
MADPHDDPGFGQRTVSLFWDLDNKPPKVRPYDVAQKLRTVAGRFGTVVEMVAYANRHAFNYVPQWVRDERKERRVMDVLETKGVVVPSESYACGLCGRKCKTNFDLKKHFKQLHQRERQKRMTRLNMLKGKRKTKFRERISDKETRYMDASRTLVLPKVGYGLAAELRRAGVYVRTVEDKPQAADIALQKQITASFTKGLDYLCLVSDDTDFAEVLRTARARNFSIIVVGETPALRKFADVWLSWGDLALGKPQIAAIETSRRLTETENSVQDLEPELEDDDVWTRSFAHSSDYKINNNYNLSGENASHTSYRRAQVSAFSEDEDEFLEEEEEEEEFWEDGNLADGMDNN